MKICFLLRALTYAIDHLMTNKAEHECLGQQARQVCERSSIGSILEHWDELFADVRRRVPV